MKLNQEELFMLSQIYGEGMDKKSFIEELSSIDKEGNFLKKLILKLESLSEGNLKIVLENGWDSLTFSLRDLDK